MLNAVFAKPDVIEGPFAPMTRDCDNPIAVPDR